jgi:hypothetical protein
MWEVGGGVGCLVVWLYLWRALRAGVGGGSTTHAFHPSTHTHTHTPLHTTKTTNHSVTLIIQQKRHQHHHNNSVAHFSNTDRYLVTYSYPQGPGDPGHIVIWDIERSISIQQQVRCMMRWRLKWW